MFSMLFLRGGLLTTVLFVLRIPCFGQETVPSSPATAPRREPLVTDRPDFTESALTVPNGLYQAEFGTTFSRFADDSETAFGELLLRIGWGKRLEARIAFPNYRVTHEAQGGRSTGFSDASVGVKINLARAGDRLGLRQYDVGLILATTLPVGSPTYRESKTQPGIKFLLSSSWTDAIAVSANLNYDYVSDEGRQYGEASSSLSFGFAVNDRVGVYAEYFGVYAAGGNGLQDSHFVNVGTTYLASNDLQLDARVGKGLNGITDDYFVGVGTSIRF